MNNPIAVPAPRPWVRSGVDNSVRHENMKILRHLVKLSAPGDDDDAMDENMDEIERLYPFDMKEQDLEVMEEHIKGLLIAQYGEEVDIQSKKNELTGEIDAADLAERLRFNEESAALRGPDALAIRRKTRMQRFSAATAAAAAAARTAAARGGGKYTARRKRSIKRTRKRTRKRSKKRSKKRTNKMKPKKRKTRRR